MYRPPQVRGRQDAAEFTEERSHGHHGRPPGRQIRQPPAADEGSFDSHAFSAARG